MVCFGYQCSFTLNFYLSGQLGMMDPSYVVENYRTISDDAACVVAGMLPTEILAIVRPKLWGRYVIKAVVLRVRLLENCGGRKP